MVIDEDYNVRMLLASILDAQTMRERALDLFVKEGDLALYDKRMLGIRELFQRASGHAQKLGYHGLAKALIAESK